MVIGIFYNIILHDPLIYQILHELKYQIEKQEQPQKKVPGDRAHQGKQDKQKSRSKEQETFLMLKTIDKFYRRTQRFNVANQTQWIMYLMEHTSLLKFKCKDSLKAGGKSILKQFEYQHRQIYFQEMI